MRKLLTVAALTLGTLLIAPRVEARTRYQAYATDGSIRTVGTLSGSFVNTLRACPSSTVSVYLAGTGTLATIYSNSTGTIKPSTFTTSTIGLIDFWADDGNYKLVLSGGGCSTRVLDNITIGANSLPYEYVDGLGADGAANTATLQAVIDSYEALIVAGTIGGVKIVLPGLGVPIPMTGGVTIQQDRIHIEGGGEWATKIAFTPTGADQIAFDFARSNAAILYQCSLANLSLTSTDTTYKKTAVRVRDNSGFDMNNVTIGPQGAWTGASDTSIGLLIQGRDFFSIRRNQIAADIPIRIENNPTNPAIDFDVSTISDNLLIADNNPNIWAGDNVLLTNVSIRDNSMNLGSYGIYYNDTNASGQSYAVTIQGNRWEQAQSAGWLVYWNRTVGGTLSLSLLGNMSGGPSSENGFYLRNLNNVVITNNVITGSGVAVNADSSVSHTTLTGNFFSATSTVTTTGQVRKFRVAGGPNFGDPVDDFEVWTSTSNVYYDERGVRVTAGPSTATYSPMGVLNTSVGVGAATTASATEQTLWTYTLPASALATDWKRLNIDIWGTTGATANTKTVRFKFGATSITLNPTTTAPNGVLWHAQVLVFRNTNTQQYAMADARFGTAAQTMSLLAPTETLSGAVVLSVTGEPAIATANEIILYSVDVTFK